MRQFEYKFLDFDTHRYLHCGAQRAAEVRGRGLREVEGRGDGDGPSREAGEQAPEDEREVAGAEGDCHVADGAGDHGEDQGALAAVAVG